MASKAWTSAICSSSAVIFVLLRATYGYRSLRALGAPLGLELLAIEGLIDAPTSHELVNGIGGNA